MSSLASTVLAVCVVGSALVLSAPPAVAWGNTGHELTAQIATALLTPEAAAAASKILDGASLVSVATWADKVKHEHGYYWSAPLHFVNTPDWACHYAASDCPDNACVVGAINNYTSRITSQTGEQLQEALKFTVHFCGDVTQPLHVAFGSDHGGNYIKGDFYGDYTELHAVWDYGIIEHRMNQSFGGDQESYGDFLTAAVQSGGNFSSNATSWTQCSSGAWLCPDEWATDTAGLACSHAYTESDGTVVPNYFDLGDTYFEWTYRVVDEQLAKAGVRMAYTLNKLLGSMVSSS